MPAYTTIARPYAKAAFDYALENDAVVSWGQFLQMLAFIISDLRVKKLLQNPRVELPQKVNFLSDLFEENLSKAQNNFLLLLADRNRLLCLPDLSTLYSELVKKYQQILDVNVETAFELSEMQKQNLTKALEIRLRKRISLLIKENKQLIGGLIIHAGDFVFDGSTRSKLKRLRKTLTR